MNTNPNRRKRGKWLVLTAVVVVVLAVAGLAIYFEYATCVGLACGPVAQPVIQNAHANTPSGGETNCQLASFVAVCSVYINGGDSGTLTLNVSNINQRSGTSGSRIQLIAYSSEADYINFTSTPPCAYTSAPDLDSPSCPIYSSSPQTFQFTFVVSQSYGSASSREPASITIMMYQSCCTP